MKYLRIYRAPEEAGHRTICLERRSWASHAPAEIPLYEDAAGA